MIVIADTTPLISLMKIDQLILLEKLFGNVWIPEAVFHELTANALFEKEIQQIKDCKYIHEMHIGDKNAVGILQRATGLDMGESEAILLVKEQRGELLLMDEMKGRSVAQQMGIRIMGTIGILMVALEKGKISYEEIIQAIEILRDTGRHIKEDLYLELLKEAGKYRDS